MRRLFFLLIILLPLTSSSQEWRYIHPYKGVNIFTRLTLAYDNNIYKYSQNEIDKFVNNIEPYRYPIETYDDLITTMQIHAKIRGEIIKNNSSTLNLRIRGNLFYKNKEKNYESYSLSIWQKAGKNGHILLRYLFLPEFLIRHYADFDIESPYSYPYFAECTFTKHDARVEGGYTFFRSTDISLFFAHEIDDYIDNFDEYDTKKNTFGVSLSRPFGAIFTPTARYSFSRAVAEAVDEPGEVRAMSDDSDISNDEDEVVFATDFDFTKTVPFLLQADLEFTRRVYTTDKPILVDPYHAGREDKKIFLRFQTSFVPTERISLDVGYLFETKSVYSPYNVELIEEVKNYNKSTVYTNIQISY
jgi:hypothetical protein